MRLARQPPRAEAEAVGQGRLGSRGGIAVWPGISEQVRIGRGRTGDGVDSHCQRLGAGILVHKSKRPQRKP